MRARSWIFAALAVVLVAAVALAGNTNCLQGAPSTRPWQVSDTAIVGARTTSVAVPADGGAVAMHAEYGRRRARFNNTGPGEIDVTVGLKFRQLVRTLTDGGTADAGNNDGGAGAVVVPKGETLELPIGPAVPVSATCAPDSDGDGGWYDCAGSWVELW